MTHGQSVVTHVVIVDDDALARRWLRMIIEPQADLELVGEAEDGLVAISLASHAATRCRRHRHPDGSP